jgi:D-alanyl-D-alanine dipeptidase
MLGACGRGLLAVHLSAGLIGAQGTGADSVAPKRLPDDPYRLVSDAARLKPRAAAPQLAALVGEYGSEGDTVIVFERGGRLFALVGKRESPVSVTQFSHGRAGRPRSLVIGTRTLPRRPVGTEEGVTFRVAPLHPIEELRMAALAATPPFERDPHRASVLTEIVALEPHIRLDIRYATDNNFLGTPVYSSARAFLQRPAADALVRVHRALAPFGYGLLVHDAYRPWYVTRMFWDATAGADHEFVANPATGSRHNRGAAVDLTLYDLRTGSAVRMPGGYDEFSHRSHASYPGGTSLQRWLRDLLRREMESEGFSVNPSEWWHFDFNGWSEYPLLNVPFEQVGSNRQASGRGLARTEKFEPNALVGTRAAARGIPEQLCGTATSVAAPRSRWRHDVSGVQRTPKTCLVQPASEQKLVD